MNIEFTFENIYLSRDAKLLEYTFFKICVALYLQRKMTIELDLQRNLTIEIVTFVRISTVAGVQDC